MLDQTDNPVREHNRDAAAMWNAGGAHYDEVSFAISDALAHAAQRFAPVPGSHVLDIATGTGWTARNCARMGARVTAVDIATELLAAAREFSAGLTPPIEFIHADAEDMPFADGAMDGVISTFGIMFAADQLAAASELARICKPGGRMVLATWVPNSAVARFFGLIADHSGAPPPAASPLNWGDPGWLQDTLGKHFELVFEPGTNRAYHENEDAVWDWYLRGFGPLRNLHDRLDETARARLKTDVDAYHAKYRVEAGLRIDRDYLVVIGKRK